MLLNKRLLDSRTSAGLTQEQVADRVRRQPGGMRFTQQHLQKLENNPDARTSYIVQLAVALEVDPYWLALGIGNPNHNRIPSVYRDALLECYEMFDKVARAELIGYASFLCSKSGNKELSHQLKVMSDLLVDELNARGDNLINKKAGL